VIATPEIRSFKVRRCGVFRCQRLWPTRALPR